MKAQMNWFLIFSNYSTKYFVFHFIILFILWTACYCTLHQYNGIVDSMAMSLSKLWNRVKGRTGRPGVLAFTGRRSQTWPNDWTAVTMSVQYWQSNELSRVCIFVSDFWNSTLSLQDSFMLLYLVTVHPITLMGSIPFF